MQKVTKRLGAGQCGDNSWALTTRNAPRSRVLNVLWGLAGASSNKIHKLLVGARRRILVFITRRFLAAEMSTECVFGRISDCDEE
jgi:hypothetical protein